MHQKHQPSYFMCIVVNYTEERVRYLEYDYALTGNSIA